MIVGDHGLAQNNNATIPEGWYQGPPVVSAIQAIDQYGHVIATAQNPKVYEMMKQY